MAFVRFYYDPITEFDRLFDDARVCPLRANSSTEAKQTQTPQGGRVFRPRLDLHESKESNTMTATFELPGLTSNDVTIDVQQNRLTVSGEFAHSDSEEDKSYVVRERRSGKFSRTLQLPFGTQSEDVNAKMENGVLTITFPKTTPAQEAKQIIIQ